MAKCTTCHRPAPPGRGPTAKHLTVAELPAHSRAHLDYEIGMLVDSAQAWNSSLPQTIRNALTESFAVHLRNLIAFLDPAGGEMCGDVSAKAFFASPDKWVPPTLSAALGTARRRAHREIVHLTVDRVPGSEKGKEWDPKLIDDVMIHLKTFVDRADQDRLHPEVRARVLALTPQGQPGVAVRSSAYLNTEADSSRVSSTAWGSAPSRP